MKSNVKKPEEMSRDELIRLTYEMYDCYKELEDKYERIKNQVYESIFQFDTDLLLDCYKSKIENDKD